MLPPRGPGDGQVAGPALLGARPLLRRGARADWRDLAPPGTNHKAAPPPARGRPIAVCPLHLFPAGNGSILSAEPISVGGCYIPCGCS